MTSEAVKACALGAGASVAGIAAAEAFTSAPEGFKPEDAFPGCRSVIVLGAPMPKEAIQGEDTTGFIDIRNEVNAKLSETAKAIVKLLKAEKHKAKAISGMSGKYVDGFTHGPISLKHAAELAGLGVIGRNYLLINREYGTLLWLNAVLTDAELTPDERLQFSVCENCNICAEACPVGALDMPGAVNKKGCSGHMFKMIDKKWEIVCFQCRKRCPYWEGCSA